MIQPWQDASNNSTIEKYCYNNDPNNCATYGGLYQWNEAMGYSRIAGTKGICPDGWHIPTKEEYETLAATINNDGNSLKAIGQGPGTNSTGFSALLAGIRNNNATFSWLGTYPFVLISTETSSSDAYHLVLRPTSGGIYFEHSGKEAGFSVRCIKDETAPVGSIKISSPNGGENWQAGTAQNIKWTNSGVTNVKIEYSKDNGTSWSIIIANTMASNGNYTWTIPNNHSTNCIVKISDAYNLARNDVSDNLFQISSLISNPCAGVSIVSYAGKTYNTVQIGAQCWLKENLDVGAMIQGNQSASNNNTIEKYCYDNDPNNCKIYGGLYQWNEAMAYSKTLGEKGICPDGWHIPTLKEFETLSAVVNNDGNALIKIGEVTGMETNTSGFTALWAGYRNSSGSFYYDNHYFLSSTEFYSVDTYPIGLSIPNSSIYFSNFNKDFGFSVRCIKDGSVTSAEQEDGFPNTFELKQNYPNPFNPGTTISYRLSAYSKVTLKVFDILGREVATLINEYQQPGNFVKTFDGKSLSSGFYFYTLRISNPAGHSFTDSKKMLLIK
ncbi:MAG: T9SS type A sorting domain-containing protein [Melioribacter sp.]|nr:T9SS type A sorting domain-containing protein [Melioribacter sp.]